MKKETRAEIAAETLAIIDRGGYCAFGGQTVELRGVIDAAVQGTRLFDLPSVNVSVADSAAVSVRLTVTSESTLAAIERMATMPGGHLACLNFASAKNPGGGFLNGAQAQEETLARSSALYGCLVNAREFYERNRRHSSTLYLDLALFSPRVPFFRRDDGALLSQPIFASVITCPAPNAGAIRQNEPARTSEIEPALARRARLVLHVARHNGVRRLILGAWGCGVFRNDPRMVARVFAELLAPDGDFHRFFDEVVFAVFDQTADRSTLRAFQAVLAPETGQETDARHVGGR